MKRVKEYVKEDPNLLTAKLKGFAPIHYSAFAGKASILKYFIQKGANVNLKGEHITSTLLGTLTYIKNLIDK